MNLSSITNVFKKEKKQGRTSQERYGLNFAINETFITMGYYKMQMLRLIDEENIDIRIRVIWAYRLFHLYRAFGRPWKNKQMKDRARGCEGLMAVWREDSQKLYYLEKKEGKSLQQLKLDPHSEEYDVKVFALTTVIPILLLYVGDVGGDEDIAPKDIAMFQTPVIPTQLTEGNRSPPDRPASVDLGGAASQARKLREGQQ